MGGIGSGNRWNHSAGPTVNDYRSLDVRRLKRAGRLSPGQHFGWQWTRDGEAVASIVIETQPGAIFLDYSVTQHGGEREEMRYRVPLDWTDCHLGGVRPWFRCPVVGCRRRVAVLYGGRVFACRKCHRLAYPSQREDASDRAARRADKIRERLGWDAGILNGPGSKPKGMHWRTYERLVQEHDRWSDMSLGLMLQKFSAIPTFRVEADAALSGLLAVADGRDE